MGDGEVEPDADDADPMKKKPEPAKMGKSQWETLAAKYSKEAREATTEKARYAALEKANANMALQLESVNAEKREAVRKADYAKLKADGYLFDESAELAHVAKYSDDQFDAHMKLARANYKQLGPQHKLFVPGGKVAPASDDAEARDKASLIAAQAVEKNRKAGERGEKVDYDKQLDIALKPQNNVTLLDLGAYCSAKHPAAGAETCAIEAIRKRCHRVL